MTTMPSLMLCTKYSVSTYSHVIDETRRRSETMGGGIDDNIFVGNLFDAACDKDTQFLTMFDLLHIKKLGCKLRSWLSMYGFGPTKICNHIWNFIGTLEMCSLELGMCQMRDMTRTQQCHTFLDLDKILHTAKATEMCHKRGIITRSSDKSNGNGICSDKSTSSITQSGDYIHTLPGEWTADNQTKE